MNIDLYIQKLQQQKQILIDKFEELIINGSIEKIINIKTVLKNDNHTHNNHSNNILSSIKTKIKKSNKITQSRNTFKSQKQINKELTERLIKYYQALKI